MQDFKTGFVSSLKNRISPAFVSVNLGGSESGFKVLLAFDHGLCAALALCEISSQGLKTEDP